MLRNLKEIHRTAEDWLRLIAVQDRLLVLLPDAWAEYRDRGLAWAEMGDARLAVDDLTVNLLTREVARAGRQIDLTAREFALLESLMRSPGRVLTRAQICEQVWDYNFDPGTNLVEVYIQRLRKKVDEDASAKLIHTIRGVGYCLKAGA